MIYDNEFIFYSKAYAKTIIFHITKDFTIQF